MSRSRHGTPLIAYSLSPLRNRMRVIVTSLNSRGSNPAELSSVRLTSARPRAGRFSVPAKMTSSIFCERTAFGACAPRTQAMASTTLDLPDPFGPTTTVTPGSSAINVESANDLKPLRVRLFRNTWPQTLLARDPRFAERSRRSADRDQRWHRGQKCVDRWPVTIRRIQPFPHVEQRSPSRP